MRIALFSDVHGNLTGLRAVLEGIDGLPEVDQVVFAGDACMFGPRPLECILELREREISCIVGNTDHWILNPPPMEESLEGKARQRRIDLRELSRWTHASVGEEGLSWLEDLDSSFDIWVSPTPQQKDDLLIVHANPHDLLQVIFPSETRQKELYGQVRQHDDELKPIVGGIRASMIAFGHLHIPNQRNYGNISLVNISSVSLPGDGDVRAKFTTMTWGRDGGWEVELHHMEYSAEEEVRALEDRKPPGWREAVESYQNHGCIPQNV